MARIRYLKPEFFTDEELSELPFEARLLYAGLWCHADKSGRQEDRPKYLKAMIFPYDRVDIEKLLELLSQKPFINRYETDGKRFIEIPSWDRHQKPHHTEKESTIPPGPPQDKGKGELKQLNPSKELRNGLITVKEPLNNKKIKFLEFVLLTDSENQSLIDKFGDSATKDYIKRLNNYIGSKGKKYKSHYHTILSWSDKDYQQTETTIDPIEQEYIKKYGHAPGKLA
jgi:hypothetical protein